MATVTIKKPPKEKPERVVSEDVEQMCLFRWAKYRTGSFPELRVMFAIPNGGFRHIQTAARLKATGVKAGVPDICLPVAVGHYHGLFIEMKRRKGGRVSDAQSEFMGMLRHQGYCCIVCKGWEEAAMAIEKYLMGGIL